MRVILFGATGMVGQGVLRECLLDADVERVLAPVRKAGSLGARVGDADLAATGKVRELVVEDFYNFAGVEGEFAGYDACFFCLGVSSSGMKEAEYRRLTYDLTLAAASSVLKANAAAMTFVYVSGAGTDTKGRMMWARVKGETENAMLGMGFAHAYVLRPLGIVPMHGIRSKTAVYQSVYTVMTPMLPLLLRMFPKHVTTTEQMGRAMLRAGEAVGIRKRRLEAADIVNAVAGGELTRNWVEIDETRLKENYAQVRAAAGPDTDVLAVVKANAYGHGLEQCAVVLAHAGARWLGVGDAAEARGCGEALSAAAMSRARRFW